MIDSRASGIFIKKSLAESHKNLTLLKKDPVVVEFIDQSSLTEGTITHHTKPLKILIQGINLESIAFDVINCFHGYMILGLSSLERQKPSLIWKSRSVRFLR
ncbi:Retrotransposon-derived protein PEG10 [Smittium culicis]|uniref:Retrotransposon-derived protein PEG10 n=1 Tax=Smittium culicis TaxID=133412 RepID=A0A1R1YH15_9FUNG|nr:Retrotransposon-derived protein PEG10 [Smittium culicis]